MGDSLSYKINNAALTSGTERMYSKPLVTVSQGSFQRFPLTRKTVVLYQFRETGSCYDG